MFWLYLAVIAVVGYLLGCVNGAIIISKYVMKKDVRTLGSGNAGLTNFYRNFGKKAAVWVVLIDVLKSVVSGLFAGWLMGRLGYKMLGQEISLLFVVLGHMFPVFSGFRGGKGILTCVGGVLVFDWRVIALLLAVFIIVTALTKYVSLGSISACVAYPLLMLAFHGDLWLTVIAAATGLAIIAKHSGNIKRLIRGEEPKFKLKK